MSEISLLINGQKKAASNGATFQRHNPLDGKVATTAPAATTEDAVAAVEAASKAFPEWAAMGPTARRELLNKAADAMQSKVDEFITAVAGETGASAMWAGFNMQLAATIEREDAKLSYHIYCY